jgi:hypothetical protein
MSFIAALVLVVSFAIVSLFSAFSAAGYAIAAGMIVDNEELTKLRITKKKMKLRAIIGLIVSILSMTTVIVLSAIGL